MRLHLVLSAKHRGGRSIPLISERKVHEIIKKLYGMKREKRCFKVRISSLNLTFWERETHCPKTVLQLKEVKGNLETAAGFQIWILSNWEEHSLENSKLEHLSIHNPKPIKIYSYVTLIKLLLCHSKMVFKPLHIKEEYSWCALSHAVFCFSPLSYFGSFTCIQILTGAQNILYTKFPSSKSTPWVLSAKTSRICLSISASYISGFPCI